MIDIILSGCNGKMGKVIVDCISKRDDCQIVGGVDLVTTGQEGFPVAKSIGDLTVNGDVVIDFSHPSSLQSLIDYCSIAPTPVVLSTTGYDEEQIELIKSASKDTPIFFSGNMSLGINLLMSLAKKATAVLGNDFDIEIIEKHHNQKIDAPSGTALMIANTIKDELATNEREANYVYDRHLTREKRTKNEIGIHAVRGGTIVGEHEVIFAGRDEIVTLSHSALSKEVFAVGSVNAAIYLAKQKAGLYNMSDMI